MRRRRQRSGHIDTGCPVEWSHPLNRSLLAWWAGLPASGWHGGLTLRDVVRGARTTHDGTHAAGSPLPAPGPNNVLRATKYSSTGRTTCGTPASLQIGTNLTVSLWCRQTSVTGFQKILWYSVTNELRGYGFHTNGSGSATPLFHVGDGTKRSATSSTALTANRWHHLCGTFDGATVRIYLDGVQTGTASITTTISYTSVLPFHISGIDSSLSTTQGFVGDIADVRVSARTFSASEVPQLFHQGRQGNPDLLRWLSTTRYFAPQQAAAAGNRRRRLIICGSGQ